MITFMNAQRAARRARKRAGGIMSPAAPVHQRAAIRHQATVPGHQAVLTLSLAGYGAIQAAEAVNTAEAYSLAVDGMYEIESHGDDMFTVTLYTLRGARS